mgnify:CR=1 FL=1
MVPSVWAQLMVTKARVEHTHENGKSWKSANMAIYIGILRPRNTVKRHPGNQPRSTTVSILEALPPPQIPPPLPNNPYNSSQCMNTILESWEGGVRGGQPRRTAMLQTTRIAISLDSIILLLFEAALRPSEREFPPST